MPLSPCIGTGFCGLKLGLLNLLVKSLLRMPFDFECLFGECLDKLINKVNEGKVLLPLLNPKAYYSYGVYCLAKLVFLHSPGIS